MTEYGHIKDTFISEIMQDVGESGLALYLYYSSKTLNFEWRNESVAEELNWSLAKVKRVKKQLQMTGWIDYWRSKGNTYYYIGRSYVRKSRKDRTKEGAQENPYYKKQKDASHKLEEYYNGD